MNSISPYSSAGLIIPASFWLLSSISYYYQVKIRGVMDNIRDRLRERNSELIIHGTQLNVIDRSRFERDSFLRVCDTFSNHSMWLYFLLVSADLILWFMFSKDVIRWATKHRSLSAIPSATVSLRIAYYKDCTIICMQFQIRSSTHYAHNRIDSKKLR